MTNRSKKLRNSKSSRARKRRLGRSQKSQLDFQTLEPRNLLASIVVSNATDVISPTANTSSIALLRSLNGGDGISLREAIEAANNTQGDDTITFDSNVFTGSDNSVIRLVQGELVINDGLEIDGTSVGGVLISGDANGDDITVGQTHITDVLASIGNNGAVDDFLDDNSRVLNLSGFSENVVLSGLTITGGREQTDGSGGGGILFRAENGTLTLNQSTVSGNSTARGNGSGGGIRASAGNVSLNNSTVSGNLSNGNGGGDDGGGGIFTNSGNVTLTNSTVSDNIAGGAGGGIRTNSGDVFLTNSTLGGNVGGSDGSGGGGIFNNDGNVTLTNSTASGNVTGSSGAGIRINFGVASLINSTLSGNDSGHSGGGIYNRSGHVSLLSSTLVDNSASNAGGGIFVADTDSNASLTINNTIVASNLSNRTRSGSGTPNDLEPDPDGVLAISNSLIGVGDGLMIDSVRNFVGTATSPLDPMLATLADNGGPTQTHRLLPFSPAIGNGDDALSAELLTDQRGETRSIDESIDIGAYELQSQMIGPKVTSVIRDEGGSLARPDLFNTFLVTFDQVVDVDVDDLIIQNDTLGEMIATSSVDFSYDEATLTAIWDFSNLELEASFYTFELSDSITDVFGGQALDGDGDGVAGGDFTEEVYVAIPGDANLDGDVEVNEINLFSGTNTGDGATVLSNLDRGGTFTWSEGDFNGDGDVDSSQLNIFTGEQNGDYAVFLANLGRNVRPVSSQPVTIQLVTFQPVTSQSFLAQPLPEPIAVSQPLISLPVAIEPDTLSASATVQANSEIAEPVNLLPVRSRELTSFAFDSELVASFEPANESILSGAEADVELTRADVHKFMSATESNGSSIALVNSTLNLYGAHDLVDGIFSGDLDRVEYQVEGSIEEIDINSISDCLSKC